MAAKKAKHMTVKEIKKIVAGLSLQQKAYLTTGVGSWETAEFPKKGIPKEWMCDGPHGLRKQINDVHA
ncbi:MAG: hypothetical protein J6P78_07015, partial [Lachnospiraceae bacterium]|nr:hypothetical protein [Lachnospiraceae bacterium]